MLYEHKLHPHKPSNVNQKHEQEQGLNQRIAVMITHAFGTMQAFYILVAWMLVWMTLASLGFWLFQYDKYPFSFLLFCSNLIQLWALPVLAVGQNVLSRRAELMAEEQYKTTQKIYHDIEQVTHHLSAQDNELIEQTKVIQTILEKLACL